MKTTSNEACMSLMLAIYQVVSSQNKASSLLRVVKSGWCCDFALMPLLISILRVIVCKFCLCFGLFIFVSGSVEFMSSKHVYCWIRVWQNAHTHAQVRELIIFHKRLVRF